VGRADAALPSRADRIAQPRQPALTWEHPEEMKRRAPVNQGPAIPRSMMPGSPRDRNVRTQVGFAPGVQVHAHVDQRSNSAWFEPGCG